MHHHKWKDTDNFANMIRFARRRYDIFAEGRQEFDVNYNAKIKLHGTNAGIVFEDDHIYAQGRSRTLTPEDDNFGFARWVQDVVRPVWENIPDKELMDDMIVHGEWAGPGVQKDVALTQLEQKTFFVFAIEIKRDDPSRDRHLIIEPKSITQNLQTLVDIPNFKVLPWFYDFDFLIDLYDQTDLENFMEKVNRDVEQIGVEDPYIKEVFGKSGKGEGLVFFDRDSRSEHLIFKAKCEEHRTTKTKNAVHANPVKIAENAEFAASLVTEARLQQGYDVVSENGNRVLVMQNLPEFLKWVAADVEKECQAEFEANDKTWKDVAKAVNMISVSYFKRRLEADAIIGA